MLGGLALTLGVLGQKGQQIVRVDGPDVPVPELFIEPLKEQLVTLDRIFSPSLSFDNQ
jgi:hypothetical protein